MTSVEESEERTEKEETVSKVVPKEVLQVEKRDREEELFE